MYAVIAAGGHQYRVSQGEEVTVDHIQGKDGDKVTFDKVLMVGGDKPKIGKPYVGGAKVEATIKRQERAPKIIVYRFRRRHTFKRKKGHKQPLTVVEINNISG